MLDNKFDMEVKHLKLNYFHKMGSWPLQYNNFNTGAYLSALRRVFYSSRITSTN